MDLTRQAPRGRVSVKAGELVAQLTAGTTLGRSTGKEIDEGHGFSGHKPESEKDYVFTCEQITAMGQ